MPISEETISRVREESDIAEIISEVVPDLKQAGKDFKGLCPFHQEKTPSFMVSPAKGIFHCFGCGVGGDIFKFIMETDRCSYPESIEKLADRAGIPLQTKNSNPRFSIEQERRKKGLGILERAMDFYHKALLNSENAKAARGYLLEKRGLRQESIQKFKLGWAPKGPRALLTKARKSGIKETDLLEVGLISRSQKTGQFLDWFRGRIIFPIFDSKGQIVGFGGRILEEVQPDNGYTPPKYLNSPETSFFQKGKNLYGFFEGSKMIREKRQVILLEGYMDVIGCHQAGIQNSAAPLGTSLTVQQGYLLKRHAKQVTLLFDSDNAGENAAIRGADLLLELGFIPMVARLPDRMDADEFLTQFKEAAFQKLLKQAVNMIEFKFQSLWKKNQDSPEIVRKSIVSQEILPLLLKMENQVLRREMLRILSSKLNVNEESLSEELRKLKNKTRNAQKRRDSFKKSKEDPSDSQSPKTKTIFLGLEEELFCLALRNPHFLKRLEPIAKDGEFFQDQNLKVCYRTLIAEKPITLEALLTRLEERQASWLRTILLKQLNYNQTEETIFESLLTRFETKIKEHKFKLVSKKAAESINEGIFNEDVTQFQKMAPSLKGSHS